MEVYPHIPESHAGDSQLQTAMVMLSALRGLVEARHIQRDCAQRMFNLSFPDLSVGDAYFSDWEAEDAVLRNS